MKLFKIWVIALIAFNLNTDLFAQSCKFSNMEIEEYPAKNAGMSDENYCFRVSIETPNQEDLYITMNGCTSTSIEDDAFSAIVCYGPDACGSYDDTLGGKSIDLLIECGIMDNNGGVFCFDGCIVTIEPTNP